MECAIEDGRGNLLLQLRGDVAHRFEEAIEVKAGPGRGEDHGREIEKEQVLLHPLPEFHERGHEPGFVPVPRLVFAARHLLLARGAHRLLDEVPFVDYHNARLFFREDLPTFCRPTTASLRGSAAEGRGTGASAPGSGPATLDCGRSAMAASISAEIPRS